MTRRRWSSQDAKKRFSAIVDAAMVGQPRLITLHSRRSVIAADEFERLNRFDRTQAPTFADLLLAIPQDDGNFERATVRLRDVEL